MAGPIVVAIDGNNRGLQTSIGQSESKLKGLGRVAGGVGKAVGAGLLVAGVAIGSLGVKTVQLASTAEQSLGATETVFGKYADQVVRQSKRADKQLGLSGNSYRESANLLGSLFRNQGVAADQLAGKTNKLIARGADLAATFGGPTSQAVEALGSAFKGEFDPLERYGISIKQSALNAELAARGQDKLTGAALKQAQQQATTRLIMEQSTRSAGAFGRESDTLANRQQVLGAQLENVGVKIGSGITPALTRLGTTVIDHVMPGVSKLADKYTPKLAAGIDALAGKLPGLVSGFDGLHGSTGGSGADLRAITGDLRRIVPEVKKAAGELPDLNDALKVGATVTGFAADHIGLLTKALPFLVAGLVLYKGAQVANILVGRDSLVGFGLQLAATRSLVIANRQLAASLTAVNIAGGGSVAGVGAATSKISKLGAVSKVAGGAAGLGLVTHGTTQTSKAMGTLETAAGGALTGFAVGGPWGAAIGAGAGALLGLWQATKKVSDATPTAADEARKYATQIDAIAGASGRARREESLRLLTTAGIIGPAKQLGIETNVLIAALDGDARANRAVAGAWKTHQGVLDAMNLEKVTHFLTEQGFALKLSDNKLAENRAALKKWDGKLDETGNKIPKTNDQLRKLGDVKPGNKWTQLYTGDLDGAQRTTRSKLAGISGDIRTGSASWRINTGPMSSGLLSDVRVLAGRARTEAEGVGNNVSSGFAAGIGELAHLAETAATVLVNAAIAAGDRAAKNKSPSRKTRESGRNMARGYAKGLDKTKGEARKAARGLVNDVLKALREGPKAIGKLDLAKRFDDEQRRLGKLAQRYGTVTTALTKAQARVASLRKLVADTRGSAIDFASIVGAGGDDDVKTAGSIIQGKLERLEAIRAFSANIAALTEAGLNRTALQQLISAGVEGGSATAAALVAGGAQSIKEVNKLDAQIEAAAGNLGSNAANAMFTGGVAAANGLVAGLQSRQDALEKAARRIAAGIAKAMRKAGLDDGKGGKGGKRPQAPRITVGDTRSSTRPQVGGATLDAARAGRTAVTIKLTAEQLTALQRGKAIRADLDAYENDGGRRAQK